MYLSIPNAKKEVMKFIRPQPGSRVHHILDHKKKHLMCLDDSRQTIGGLVYTSYATQYIF